jgi:hypothetical protein
VPSGTVVLALTRTGAGAPRRDGSKLCLADSSGRFVRTHDTSDFYREWCDLRAAQREADADESLGYYVKTHCFVTHELFNVGETKKSS